MKAKSIFVKIISLLTVIFVTGTVVSAQNVDTSGGGSATITIENASQGKDYTLYKLFDATVGANGEIAYTVPSGKEMSVLKKTLTYQVKPSRLGLQALVHK